MLTKALTRYSTLVNMVQSTAFSTSIRSKYLVDTEEVASLIEQAPGNLRLVNATWFLPNVDRDPKKEHTAGRLSKTTQFFDIDAIAEPGSKLPHTLPSAEVFTEHMKKLRIGRTD